MTEKRIVLLCGLGAAIGTPLAPALEGAGFDVRVLVPLGQTNALPGQAELGIRLGDAASIESQLDTLDGPLAALINHAAQPVFLPSVGSTTSIVPVGYAPYELYHAAIARMHADTRIVSLFGDTGPTIDPHALTLPLLKRLMRDLAPAAGEAGVRINGVSVRYVSGIGAAERRRILAERIDTVVRLVTGDLFGTGEIYRGYSQRPGSN